MSFSRNDHWSPTSVRWGKRSAVLYRLHQFFQGFNAQVSEAERQAVAQLLPAPAFALFERMPVDAQRHSLNVLYTLQAVGHQEPDLAVAALLHDVGKVAADEAGVRLGLWLRGPLVILEALAPALLNKLATADVQKGWRYALHVHLTHPVIGARWAEQAGCTQPACWLIAYHQDAVRWANIGVPPELEIHYQWLIALQQADGAN